MFFLNALMSVHQGIDLLVIQRERGRETRKQQGRSREGKSCIGGWLRYEMRCWIESEGWRGDGDVLTLVYRTTWKIQKGKNTEVRVKETFSDAVLHHLSDRCADTVASWLFWCLCVWGVCVASLLWEVAVGCITTDFLLQFTGLSCSAL